MTPLVNIRCRPLGASLSRSACGQRYLAAIGPGRALETRLLCGACRDCDLGPAHARGEAPATWADGAAVEEVVHVVAGSVLPVRSHKGPAVPAYVPRVRKLTDAPAPSRVPNPSGRNGQTERYPYHGAELTPRELAALPEAVVDIEAVHSRLRRGWSAERAVAEPLRPCLPHSQHAPQSQHSWRGQMLTTAELAALPEAALGLTAHMVGVRLGRGWNVERAVTTPLVRRGRAA